MCPRTVLAYLWFSINWWLDGFTTNIHHWQAIVPTCAFNSAVYCVFSTTIGQLLAGQCSVQYIKSGPRLNCWLVRVSRTKMSQLMADRWSVRYVPVASVQLLTLTPPIDVQVYSLVYWHLLSSLSCVSSPMWRLLWQRARMTCAQDPLPLPPTPPSQPCVSPRLIRILYITAISDIVLSIRYHFNNYS